MKYQLPIYYEDVNYGSQYLNYFLSMILWDERNTPYLYLHYLMLTVKHFKDCHVDYSFDGPVACDNRLLRKYVVYGRVETLASDIMMAIKNDAYVIVNVNEKYLPGREAYQAYDFRHDLLIYGWDEERNSFMTLGFDEDFHYREMKYDAGTVEKAYYGMKEEWDYDITFYKINEEHTREGMEIKKEVACLLDDYISGNSYCKKKWNDFLAGSENQVTLCNESFYGFHGIRAYDYLIDRIGSFASVLKRNKIGNPSLGVTDIRSFHVMISHKHVLFKMLRDRRVFEQGGDEELEKQIKRLADRLTECKMLLIYMLHGRGGAREGKRIVSILKQCREDECGVIGKLMAKLQDSCGGETEKYADGFDG